MGTSTGERSPPTARLMVRRYWAAAAISTTARDGRGAPGPPSSIPDVSELPSPPVRPAQTPERRIRRAWWIFATSFFILGLFAVIRLGAERVRPLRPKADHGSARSTGPSSAW